MAKVDVVTAQLAAIQSGINGVLSDAVGAAYDQGAADAAVAPAPGTFTQADIDAAVAAKAEELNVAMTDLHAQLDAMTAQDQIDKQALVDFKAKIAALLS